MGEDEASDGEADDDKLKQDRAMWGEMSYVFGVRAKIIELILLRR